MNVVSCPNCGGDVPVPDTDGSPKRTLVCSACGARMAVAVFVDGAETLFQPQLLGDEVEAAESRVDVDPSATVALGSGTAVLETVAPDGSTPIVDTVIQAALILAGAEPGTERFTLTQATTSVGREEADIVVSDPALSSRHFEVEIRGKEFFLRDLASSNGTRLNGNPIRAAELASGDTIVAGQSSFTFRTFEAIPL